MELILSPKSFRVAIFHPTVTSKMSAVSVVFFFFFLSVCEMKFDTRTTVFVVVLFEFKVSVKMSSVPCRSHYQCKLHERI